MPIAGLDEVSDLLSGFRIDDPAEARRLTARQTHHSAMIRDHSNLNPRDTSVTGEHLFRVVSLKLIKLIIEQTLKQLPHLVGLPVIFRNDFIKLVRRSQWLTGRFNDTGWLW